MNTRTVYCKACGQPADQRFDHDGCVSAPEAPKKPVKLYLCSRTAFDARLTNLRVANGLKKAGYDVFVPHLAPHNQADNPNVQDLDVYRYDKAEMMVADACVVVGRIGVDCAWEVGWFQANGVPVVWYVPTGVDVGRSPMLSTVDRVKSVVGVVKFLKKYLPQKRVEDAKGSAA